MDQIIRSTGKTNFLLDGFPRSLSNLTAWEQTFGVDAPLPTMVYFECPFAELEKRILGRSPFTGRVDDNVESMKLRFDTFKAETLPTVEHFKSRGKCVEIDTSLDRQAVFKIVCDQLAMLSPEPSNTQQRQAADPASRNTAGSKTLSKAIVQVNVEVLSGAGGPPHVMLGQKRGQTLSGHAVLSRFFGVLQRIRPLF